MTSASTTSRIIYLWTASIPISLFAPSASAARTFAAFFAITLSTLPASATIYRWNVEATIVDIYDPDSIFPDVRIGDPVRGFMSYDVAVPIVVENEYNAYYLNDPNALFLAGMTVENPRTVSDIRFEPIAAYFADVSLTNDASNEELGSFDVLDIAQEVSAPDGFGGASAIVNLIFLSQDALPDLSLPRELNLDDWNQAVIFIGDLIDLLVDEPLASCLYAEIHTLTPVPHPGILGDFNRDGIVDAADYTRWRDELDFYYSETHYDQWKQNFGLSAQAGGAGAPVPEPTTLALLLFASFAVLPFHRCQNL